MANALWITLIGMGLVFIAILLLWGLMALLVRLTAGRGEEPAPSAPEPTPEQPPDISQRRRRAAAAAVAVALALERAQPGAPAVDVSTALNPWQVVHRAVDLNRRALSKR